MHAGALYLPRTTVTRELCQNGYHYRLFSPLLHCVPKKPPTPWVKYSKTHNTEQKSLKITENTLLNRNHWKLQRTHWHPFEYCVLNCRWVQFQDRDIIICFQRHTKNAIFQNETVSVKSNEQSAKQSHLQVVFKMSTVTFFLTKHFNQNTIFAIDKLIKWKVRQCWHQSEQYWRQ